MIALASNAGEFNESNGVAIKGYDPVAFFTENKPVRGNDYNTQVQREWTADRTRFIRQADERWPTVSKTEKVFR